MRFISTEACAKIYFGRPECFGPGPDAFWVYDLELSDGYEIKGDYESAWDYSFPTLAEAEERAAALDRLYGSL